MSGRDETGRLTIERAHGAGGHFGVQWHRENLSFSRWEDPDNLGVAAANPGDRKPLFSQNLQYLPRAETPEAGRAH